MSARVVASSAILVAAVAVCTQWWIAYVRRSPDIVLSDSLAAAVCVLGPLFPAISVRAAIIGAGANASNLLFWIWITILGGTNTTVTGIVFHAANASLRTHAIFSRLMLVLDILNIIWTVFLFSADGYWTLWHTDRDYLNATTAFTQMSPHICVNIIALGIWADNYVSFSLGLLTALAVNGYLFMYAVKRVYTPTIKDKYRKAGGGPLELDDTNYKNLRKTVE